MIGHQISGQPDLHSQALPQKKKKVYGKCYGLTLRYSPNYLTPS